MVAPTNPSTGLKRPAIVKVEEDLAYRTPGGNKPLGHIVLEREHAERLVAEHHTLIRKNTELWDSIHAFYMHVKPDAPETECPPLPERP